MDTANWQNQLQSHILMHDSLLAVMPRVTIWRCRANGCIPREMHRGNACRSSLFGLPASEGKSQRVASSFPFKNHLLVLTVCVRMWICVHECRCSTRPEEGTGSFGSEITDRSDMGNTLELGFSPRTVNALNKTTYPACCCAAPFPSV